MPVLVGGEIDSPPTSDRPTTARSYDCEPWSVRLTATLAPWHELSEPEVICKIPVVEPFAEPFAATTTGAVRLPDVADREKLQVVPASVPVVTVPVDAPLKVVNVTGYGFGLLTENVTSLDAVLPGHKVGSAEGDATAVTLDVMLEAAVAEPAPLPVVVHTAYAAPPAATRPTTAAAATTFFFKLKCFIDAPC
jgi:hypothetical protein